MTSDNISNLPARSEQRRDLLEPETSPSMGGQGDNPDVRRIAIVAGVSVAVFLFGAAGWASLVPLSGAVLANGQIVVQSYKKTLQSKEGGTILKLHVSEGAQVEAGDPLIEFNNTQAAASYQTFSGQLVRARARKARLETLIMGATKVEWPQSITQMLATSPEVSTILAVEEALFEAALMDFAGRRNVLERRVAELRHQLASMSPQIKSIDKQLPLIAEEEADATILFEKGLERKPKLLALRRVRARLIGERGQLLAQRNQTREILAAAELELIAHHNTKQAEYSTQLTDISGRIAELEQSLLSSADRLANTIVYAPVSGEVVGLAFHTIGGVVQSGEPIMSIVPRRDELMIDAKVRAGDVDAIHETQPAEIRILAHRWRDRPPLDGEVVRISADLIRDPYSGEEHYEARLRLDLSTAPPDIKPSDLQVGMKVDVAILTEDRTPLQYISGPITRHMFKAFRE